MGPRTPPWRRRFSPRTIPLRPRLRSRDSIRSIEDVQRRDGEATESAESVDLPRDQSERVGSVLEALSNDDLRAFVCDVLAKHPELRDQFLARLGDSCKSVDAYRAEIEQLFDRHAQDYPVITDAIDFSHFFELIEQYLERGRYLDAAAIYRSLFEEIGENEVRIDAAYDHYAETLQSALDGSVECALAADFDRDEFEMQVGVLEERTTSEFPANSEQFYRAIDDLGN